MVELVLAVLVFAPLVVTYFLRSNAALGFLALCTGFVLSTSVIGDLKHLLSETHLSVTNESLGIILLAVPLLITLLFTREHARRKGVGFVLQLVVALCAGGLLALSVGPLLTSNSQINVTTASSWKNLSQAQAGVIGIGGLLSLLLIWAHNFRGPKKH